LERKRTITSIPLAQEKKILRQIEMIQRQKKTLVDAEEHEVTIQNLKVGNYVEPKSFSFLCLFCN
jgi:hypothetical protein